MKKANNTGVTLIALVVTIVILIILAAVSINVVIGEDGIIQRVKKAQELQMIATEKENIELAKASVIMNNRGKILADEYVLELINLGVTTQENVKYNEDGSIQITTNTERSLKLDVDANGNVIGITEGEVEGALTVNIKNVLLTEKTNTIKIDLEVEKGEGATYTYLYKEGTGEYVEAYKGEEISYTIEKLKSGTEYWIKIEATNDYGTVSKEISAKTKTIVTGEEGAADIQKLAEYSDQFKELESTLYIDTLGSVTAKKFVEEAIKEGITTQDNTSINSDGNYEFITKEGYVYEVIQKSSADVEVNYIGMVEN